MSVWFLLIAAALGLSVERACYVWISRAPGSFRRWCGRPVIAGLGSPIAIVRMLFVIFKLVQGAVFLGWCVALGGGLPGVAPGLAASVGGGLILLGQGLSTLVFYRLGRVGTFFGDRLGYDVPWCRDFPFSVLAHPQYVGAVLTIWGVFLLARFPHEDWVLLPILETILYIAGTQLEAAPARPGSVPLRQASGPRSVVK
jgi:methylene-fatty-acyl-phospholipid synthase